MVINMVGVGYEDGQVQILDLKKDKEVMMLKVEQGVT